MTFKIMLFPPKYVDCTKLPVKSKYGLHQPGQKRSNERHILVILHGNYNIYVSKYSSVILISPPLSANFKARVRRRKVNW
jgi:hypothetical protein